jgi:1,4-dihydroxy-6-naphthoate synthase
LKFCFLFLYDRQMPPISLTLAHSPDPDDAFMWWPLTGMISPDGKPLPGEAGTPAIDTGHFSFTPLPADIEVLNRRAIAAADLDITALSVRTWADVQDKYIITSCGASFGNGFGPKLVVRADDPRITDAASLASPELRIAIPGRRTTAFLMLGLVLKTQDSGPRTQDSRVIELPFDQIISAVSRGQADAGLVIHEGQLTFADAGLRLILDVGQWWKQKTGLKLPLGINAVNRNLDQLHGRGTITEVAALLSRSVACAMDRWDQSVRYTMAFAQDNVKRGGGLPPTLERVDRYCRMYVSEETRDMGNPGREAIRRLLAEGAAAGLCPPVAAVETV